MGRLKIVPTIQDWQRDLGESLADIFGEAAPEMIKRVFEREDPGDILADFKTYFATPAMRMWEDVIAPVVSEGFNLPGAFYSRSRFEGVQRSGEEFLTQRVNPLLFSSLENMRGRDVQRQSIIANILQGSQSLATAPTQQGLMAGQTKSGIGGVIGAGAALGLGVLTGGASGTLLGAGGLFEGSSVLDLMAGGAFFGGQF